MTLGELISWLENQPQEKEVVMGFSTPHSDRGSYENLAFTPKNRAVIGDMLGYAREALGSTYYGWKGGDFTMHEHTEVYIGNYGECGEAINSAHFMLWGQTHIDTSKGGGE